MKHGKHSIAALLCAALALAATATAPAADYAPPGELFTNVYVVPPNFLHWNSAEKEKEPDQEKPAHRSAKEVLESLGISFPDGSSAVFNPQTSQLIVRNTQAQMELVEAVVEAKRDEVETFIHLNYRIVETRAPLFPEPELPTKDAPNAEPIDPDSGATNASGERLASPG
ncbi:MAG: hypothetical protein KDM64_06110, partial [Verrucomicrobiae bacterium]|nr:hypothetical protein [Verrucomicrobiae bacterium]